MLLFYGCGPPVWPGVRLVPPFALEVELFAVLSVVLEEELPEGVVLEPEVFPAPTVIVVPVEVFSFWFPLPDTPGPLLLSLLPEELPDGVVVVLPEVLLLLFPEFAVP